MNAPAIKFVIEREFRSDGSEVPTSKKFTELDINKAKKQGETNGYNDGLKAAETGIVAKTNDAVQIIYSNCQQIRNDLEEEKLSLQKEAMELALAAAKGVCSAALDQFSQQHIVDVLSQAIDKMRSKPQLTIRLDNSLLSNVKAAFNEQFADEFDETSIEFKSTEASADSSNELNEPNEPEGNSFKRGFVEVTWQGGGFDKDPESSFKEVESIVRRRMKEISNTNQ